MAYERSITVRQLGGTFGVKRIDGQSSMIAGVAMSLPIFDWNQGGVARATGERLAAQQELAWLERTIAADVQSAHDARQRLVDHLASIQRSYVGRAEEARTIALAAYQEGATTLLQVLDATRTVADTQLTYRRALLAAEQTGFELALASGDDPFSTVRGATVAAADRPSPVLEKR
jgi:outer membrane protein TolC